MSTGHPQAELSISASGAVPCPAYTAIDRIYVEGGLYVICGVNARINQREQPVRFGETRDYSAVFEWVADQFVAFYDVTDHRGWLVDGASALLHLVRTSLQLEEINPESTYHWVFEKDKLEEDWANFSGRAASIRTLKSWKNRALPVYIKNQTFSNGQPVNTYSTFGDRVDKVLHSLELLIEYQTRIATESGIRVSQTLDTRKGLLGFDILDLVKSRPQCAPRIERFSSGDNSWVSLLPAVGVLTIFGKGFGDLICPSKPDNVCAAWRSVPRGQDYLASSISTLALLRKERLQQLGTDLEPGVLTRKLFWMSPGQPFNRCQCIKGKHVGKRDHHDPVQYVVSKPWLVMHKSKKTVLVDVSNLVTTGAVVFVNLSSRGRRVEAQNLEAPAAGPVSSSSHGSLSASASHTTAAQSSSSTAPTETSAQIAGSASDQGGSDVRGDQSISSRLREKWKGKLRTFYRT